MKNALVLMFVSIIVWGFGGYVLAVFAERRRGSVSLSDERRYDFAMREQKARLEA